MHIGGQISQFAQNSQIIKEPTHIPGENTF